MSEYVVALEAAAVTYAEKYGISDAFSYALSCKPSEDAFTLLEAAPEAIFNFRDGIDLI